MFLPFGVGVRVWKVCGGCWWWVLGTLLGPEGSGRLLVTGGWLGASGVAGATDRSACWWCGWWLSWLLVENCTVDASIFVACY